MMTPGVAWLIMQTERSDRRARETALSKLMHLQRRAG